MRRAVPRLCCAHVAIAEATLPMFMRTRAKWIDAMYGAQLEKAEALYGAQREKAEKVEALYGAQLEKVEALFGELRNEHQKVEALNEKVMNGLEASVVVLTAEVKAAKGELSFRSAWELALTWAFHIARGHKAEEAWSSTKCFPGNAPKPNASGVERWLVELKRSGKSEEAAFGEVRCISNCAVNGLYAALSSHHHGVPLNLEHLTNPDNKGLLSTKHHNAICCGLRCLGVLG